MRNFIIETLWTQSELYRVDLTEVITDERKETTPKFFDLNRIISKPCINDTSNLALS